MNMAIFVTQTTVMKESERQKELGGAVKGYFSPTFTSFCHLTGCLCSEHIHPRLAEVTETLSGVKVASSFLSLVTQYFTACFMRCSITSTANVSFSSSCLLPWVPVGGFCCRRAGCVSLASCVYFPILKVPWGAEMTQKWFPQGRKAVRRWPVCWADDHLLKIWLHFQPVKFLLLEQQFIS